MIQPAWKTVHFLLSFRHRSKIYAGVRRTKDEYHDKDQSMLVVPFGVLTVVKDDCSRIT